MENLGNDMGNYVTAATTETDEHRIVKRPAAINGGFFPKKPDWPAQYPSVVIAVEDIHSLSDWIPLGIANTGRPLEMIRIAQGYIPWFTARITPFPPCSSPAAADILQIFRIAAKYKDIQISGQRLA